MNTAKILASSVIASSALAIAALDIGGVFAEAGELQHIGLLLLCSVAFLISMTIIEGA